MMQKNESEQNRRKMRRGDKEAILKGLKADFVIIITAFVVRLNIILKIMTL